MNWNEEMRLDKNRGLKAHVGNCQCVVILGQGDGKRGKILVSLLRRAERNGDKKNQRMEWSFWCRSVLGALSYLLAAHRNGWWKLLQSLVSISNLFSSFSSTTLKSVRHLWSCINRSGSTRETHFHCSIKALQHPGLGWCTQGEMKGKR